MTTVPIPSGRSGDEERALSTLDYWSPVRPLRLIGTGVALTAIDFVDDGAGIRSRNHAAAAGPVLREAARQLDAYFRGRLLRFELPLEPGGTPFQQAVWSALQEIPHGENRDLRRAGPADRPAAGRSSGRRRQQPKPHRHRDPVPPGGRPRRAAHGLRRGPGREGGASRPRSGARSEPYRSSPDHA